MNLIIKLTVPQQQFNDTVNSILQRNEYKHLKNGLRDLIDGAKEALEKWILGVLQKTFNNLDNMPQISNKLSIVFLIIGIILFTALIGFILIKLDKAFEKKRKIQEILGEKIDSTTTPYTLKDKGDKFALGGDLRLGVRYSFIGLLLLMHENNLLYLDEANTNEEIYDYMRKNKYGSLKELSYLIEIFNISWYGHKEVGMNAYEKWHTVLEALWNEVTGNEKKGK